MTTWTVHAVHRCCWLTTDRRRSLSLLLLGWLWTLHYQFFLYNTFCITAQTGRIAYGIEDSHRGPVTEKTKRVTLSWSSPLKFHIDQWFTPLNQLPQQVTSREECKKKGMEPYKVTGSFPTSIHAKKNEKRPTRLQARAFYGPPKTALCHFHLSGEPTHLPASPTLSAYAEPISRGKFPHHQLKFSQRL